MDEDELKLSEATTQELLEVVSAYRSHTSNALTAPLVARAQGATLWDRDGRAYPDFSSG
jgi:4-aminobutyrate aminotransferase-like enzyme